MSTLTRLKLGRTTLVDLEGLLRHSTRTAVRGRANLSLVRSHHTGSNALWPRTGAARRGSTGEVKFVLVPRRLLSDGGKARAEGAGASAAEGEARSVRMCVCGCGCDTKCAQAIAHLHPPTTSHLHL